MDYTWVTLRPVRSKSTFHGVSLPVTHSQCENCLVQDYLIQSSCQRQSRSVYPLFADVTRRQLIFGFLGTFAPLDAYELWIWSWFGVKFPCKTIAIDGLLIVKMFWITPMRAACVDVRPNWAVPVHCLHQKMLRDLRSRLPLFYIHPNKIMQPLLSYVLEQHTRGKSTCPIPV